MKLFLTLFAVIAIASCDGPAYDYGDDSVTEPSTTVDSQKVTKIKYIADSVKISQINIKK